MAYVLLTVSLPPRGSRREATLHLLHLAEKVLILALIMGPGCSGQLRFLRWSLRSDPTVYLQRDTGSRISPVPSVYVTANETDSRRPLRIRLIRDVPGSSSYIR